MPGNRAVEERAVLTINACIAFMGIPNVELSMNRGAGRVDFVYRRVRADGSIVYVFVDVKSYNGWNPVNENQFIRQAAVSAASMPNTVVYVAWANWHEYTSRSGVVVAEAMQAGPAGQIRGANRALWLALNMVVPMLTDPNGVWVRVPRPTAQHPNVTIREYLAFYNNFPLFDVDSPIDPVAPADLAAVTAVDATFIPMLLLPGRLRARISDLVTGGAHTMAALIWIFLSSLLCM